MRTTPTWTSVMHIQPRVYPLLDLPPVPNSMIRQDGGLSPSGPTLICPWIATANVGTTDPNDKGAA
jgi:hypothetical protein